MKFLSLIKGLALGSLLITSVSHGASLEVWGSTTCQKRFLEPGTQELKTATGIDLTVQGVGTGRGMLALIEGRTTVAAASSELESVLNSARNEAQKAGRSVTVPPNLKFHEIARDNIVPIVHRDNPISSLTWAQLKDIHTGKITNWKEVGGPDMRIMVITSHVGSATRAVFQEEVMGKAEYVASMKQVHSTRREIEEVGNFKGAIGAVSEGFFAQNPGKTKAVKTARISRPLALITIGEPRGDAKKLIDFFLSPAGREHIQ